MQKDFLLFLNDFIPYMVHYLRIELLKLERTQRGIIYDNHTT